MPGLLCVSVSLCLCVSVVNPYFATGSTCGFQRSTGLRAAATSSSREMRVLYGASAMISGFSSASCAIAFIASMNWSSSSFDSLSVGSIISAPCTTSGKLTV